MRVINALLAVQALQLKRGCQMHRKHQQDALLQRPNCPLWLQLESVTTQSGYLAVIVEWAPITCTANIEGMQFLRVKTALGGFMFTLRPRRNGKLGVGTRSLLGRNANALLATLSSSWATIQVHVILFRWAFSWAACRWCWRCWHRHRRCWHRGLCRAAPTTEFTVDSIKGNNATTNALGAIPRTVRVRPHHGHIATRTTA